MIKGLLGIAIFLGVVLGGAALFFGFGSGALARDLTEEAKPHLEPLIDALDEYRDLNGHYPSTLEELGSTGLLFEIPKIPQSNKAVTQSGPLYWTRKDGDSFTLSFSYHVSGQGFGIGDTTYSDYRSESKEWSHSGPGFN
ncbi:MAG: hypothetical protein AAF561_04760 [Planctomycetota bacterium]